MAELIIRLQSDKPFNGLTDYYLTNLGRRIIAAEPDVPLEFEYKNIVEKN